MPKYRFCVQTGFGGLFAQMKKYQEKTGTDVALKLLQTPYLPESKECGEIGSSESR